MGGDQKGTFTSPHLVPTDSLRAQLQITAEEEAKAFFLIEKVSSGVPTGDYWRDVAWCLALDAVRKKKTGDKLKWPKATELEFVTTIKRELRRRQSPRFKKTIELREVLKEMQSDPRWPRRDSGKKDAEGNPISEPLTVDTMRGVYYRAKPKWDRFEALAQAQGGSLLDDGWSLSVSLHCARWLPSRRCISTRSAACGKLWQPGICLTNGTPSQHQTRTLCPLPPRRRCPTPPRTGRPVTAATKNGIHITPAVWQAALRSKPGSTSLRPSTSARLPPARCALLTMSERHYSR
jgi:hypothetical protein